MRFRILAATDPGRVRQRNEDSFYADGIGNTEEESGFWQTELKQTQCLCAVCDGMGGESLGREASRLAVSVMKTCRQELTEKTDVTAWTERYVTEANHQICEMAFREHCRISGSTLAMVSVAQGMVSVFHIGDSRVYYYHAGELRQITEDQTLAMKKLKANIYTEEEAKHSPDAHKITSFLGVDTRGTGLKAAAAVPFPLKDGMLLLCSDGLTDMCTDEEIAGILQTEQESPAKALVGRALENGGEDNVTCIVLHSVQEGDGYGNS